MFMLRAGLLRRHWGMGDPSLFQHSLVGTKRVLEEYVETVAAALRAVSRSESAAPEDLNEKLAFFSETRHAYGRSALCLSGGATLGLWHVGVVLELRRQGLLPRVISGSSAGSIVTAIVGVRVRARGHPCLSTPMRCAHVLVWPIRRTRSWRRT